MTHAKPLISLTIDVEDWPQSSWDRSLPISDYSADNTRRVLDLIGEFPSSRATFFVLGKFADKHPAVVREIQAAGHEIGSHGYGHVEVFRQGPEKFAQDIRQSLASLSAACGVRAVGYRSPDFSIVGESLWALDILAEMDFAYDSSIFPIGKARYGIASWPQRAVRVRLKSGKTITEIPPTTIHLFNRRLPVGGGGYARLLPARLLIWAFRRAQAQLNFPPAFYSHPYEVDPQEFRRTELPIPWKVRLHQGLGRKKTASKIRRLLKCFDSVPMQQVADMCREAPVIDYAPYVLDPTQVTRPPIFEQTKSSEPA